MGFIAQSVDGKGWMDATTRANVADLDVKALYESRILQHCGIRFIEPAIANGYDPASKRMLQTVSVEQDLPAFQVTEEEADQLRAQHKGSVEIYRDDAGQQMARLLKGAVIYVPKALQFSRLVAGLLPTG
jgi:fatty acid synthase subunit alpha